MRKIFTAILAFLLLGISATGAQADTLRILAIGNSFSQDAVEQNLHEIALTYGQEMVIGNMYIGGCSLERHFNNTVKDSGDYQYRKIATDGVRHNTKGVTLEQALADEKWDIVTLQQSSPLSGRMESYEPFLSDMIAFVRCHTRSDIRLMWHQTWAYAEDSKHPHFPDYDRDQMLMYRAIMSASEAACIQHGLEVIPSGTAIQNVRGSFEGDSVTRDGYHLNNRIGRYTAALTWFESITGQDVRGCAFKPTELGAGSAAVAQAAAHAAVQLPYNVSSIADAVGVRVVAHRGCHLNPACTENSVAALKETISHPEIYGSEFDVWLTTDGRVVINHNPSYKNDPQSQIIKESSYKDLRSIRLDNGERIPILEDFLKEARRSQGTMLVCELKKHGSMVVNRALFDRVHALTLKYGMQDRIIYQTFSYEFCLYILKNYPGVKVNYLCSKEKDLRMPAELKAAGFSGVNYKYQIYDAHPELLEQCHDAGLTAGLCAEDDPAILRRFIGLGIDMIGTNHPLDVVEMLGL